MYFYWPKLQTLQSVSHSCRARIGVEWWGKKLAPKRICNRNSCHFGLEWFKEEALGSRTALSVTKWFLHRSLLPQRTTYNILIKSWYLGCPCNAYRRITRQPFGFTLLHTVYYFCLARPAASRSRDSDGWKPSQVWTYTNVKQLRSFTLFGD